MGLGSNGLYTHPIGITCVSGVQRSSFIHMLINIFCGFAKTSFLAGMSGLRAISI